MQTPCTSPYHICDKVVSLVNGANRQYKPTSSMWLNYNSGEWWLINSILRIKLIKQVTLINLNLIDPAEETSHSHHVSLQPFQSDKTISGINANWLYSLHLSCGKLVSLVNDNKLFSFQWLNWANCEKIVQFQCKQANVAYISHLAKF